MTSGDALFLRDDPFLDAEEITLPDDVAVVTQSFLDVRMSDLPEIFDEAFVTLAQAGPVGPAYAVYEGDVTDVFDLTVGFPVETPADGEIDGVDDGVFPGGRALVMSHIGGFDGLASAWDALMTVHHSQGGSAPRAVVEIYFNDPSSTPQEDLRTDLLVLY